MLFQLVFCSQKIFIVHICCCWCALCVNRDVSSILVCGEAYINWNWLPHKLLLYTKCHIDHLCVASSFCVFKHSLTMLLLVFFFLQRFEQYQNIVFHISFDFFVFPFLNSQNQNSTHKNVETILRKKMNEQKKDGKKSKWNKFIYRFTCLPYTHKVNHRVKNTLVWYSILVDLAKKFLQTTNFQRFKHFECSCLFLSTILIWLRFATNQSNQ